MVIGKSYRVADDCLPSQVWNTKASPFKYIVNEFIYCNPGKFDRLQGFDELKAQGVISEYSLYKWQGAEFDTIENSGDRIAGFTIQADTKDELKKKHYKAVEELKVLDVNGNDMMRRDLLTAIE